MATPQQRADAARAKENARLAAQRNRPKVTNSTAGQIGFRSLAETWNTPTITTMRTDTPQYAASQAAVVSDKKAIDLQNRQLDLANRQFDSESEVRTLQTDAYKRLLQGPGQGVQQGMAALTNQYNQQYGAAKSANDARFQQMLGIADSTTQQRATDIRSQASSDISSQQQQLQRVGLGGTTVGNVLAGGVRKREQESLNTLADQMQQTKLGILGQMKEAHPDLASVQSALSNVAETFEGGSGLASLLQNLTRLQG